MAFQLRFLGPNPVGGEIAGGQQDVGMGVVRIVAVDADVGDHAFGDELALDEVAQESDLFAVFKLDGQPDFDLACDLGVLAFLGWLRPCSKGYGGRISRRGRLRGRGFRCVRRPRLWV